MSAILHSEQVPEIISRNMFPCRKKILPRTTENIFFFITAYDKKYFSRLRRRRFIHKPPVRRMPLKISNEPFSQECTDGKILSCISVTRERPKTYRDANKNFRKKESRIGQTRSAISCPISEQPTLFIPSRKISPVR